MVLQHIYIYGVAEDFIQEKLGILWNNIISFSHKGCLSFCLPAFAVL